MASVHFREEATGLDILVGGGRSDLPTDTLASSQRVAQLVELLRGEYEAVVLDTAPILPVVDTLYLTPHADVILMMARYAATNQHDVRRAADRIRSEIWRRARTSCPSSPWSVGRGGPTTMAATIRGVDITLKRMLTVCLTC
jgi:hypothetical protein